MKQYEMRTVPERTEKVCVCTTCDLCGKKAHVRSGWTCFGYERNETVVKVQVKQREGTYYPESQSGTEYEVDLCPDCFKDKLIPWLISQGAKIEQKEWDF
jgi:hypothetical protein